MSDQLPAQLYADIFEDDTRGAAILEELIQMFGRNPYVKGGLEGARQTDFNAGANKPVQFILGRINQSHGVIDNVDDQE
jgi:hypothetical protein